MLRLSQFAHLSSCGLLSSIALTGGSFDSWDFPLMICYQSSMFRQPVFLPHLFEQEAGQHHGHQQQADVPGLQAHSPEDERRH